MSAARPSPSASHAISRCARRRYDSGCGIQAHSDGLLFRPHVAILSLGRPACIRFHRIAPHDPARPEAISVVLQPASLLCFSSDMYTHYTHSIAESEAETVTACCVNAQAAGVCVGDVLDCRGRRYSVTLRSVAHVAVDAETAELPMYLEERQRRRAWWLSSIDEKSDAP